MKRSAGVKKIRDADDDDCVMVRDGSLLDESADTDGDGEDGNNAVAVVEAGLTLYPPSSANRRSTIC